MPFTDAEAEALLGAAGRTKEIVTGTRLKCQEIGEGEVFRFRRQREANNIVAAIPATMVKVPGSGTASTVVKTYPHCTPPYRTL